MNFNEMIVPPVLLSKLFLTMNILLKSFVKQTRKS